MMRLSLVLVFLSSLCLCPASIFAIPQLIQLTAIAGSSAGLDATPIIISPPFSPSIYSYSASLHSLKTYVTVKAQASSSSDELTMCLNDGPPSYCNEIAVTDGAKLVFSSIDNVLAVRVRNPTTREEQVYRISLTVTPSSNIFLSDLSVITTPQQFTLQPSFQQHRLSRINHWYDITIPHSMKLNGRFAATPYSSAATVTVQQCCTGPRWPLSFEWQWYNSAVKNDYYKVFVTAPDGTERDTLVVIRRLPASKDCSLKAITSTQGTLSPPFSTAITTYRIVVPYEATAVTLNAVPTNEYAKLIDNTYPRTVALPTVGAIYPVTITVQAEDYEVSCAHHVDVIRSKNAQLTSISLSQKCGTLALSPSFQSTVTTYSATATATSLLVATNKADSTQRIHVSINGGDYIETIGIGQSVALVNGANVLRVRVTATDAAIKLYTINISAGLSCVTGSNNNA